MQDPAPIAWNSPISFLIMIFEQKLLIRSVPQPPLVSSPQNQRAGVLMFSFGSACTSHSFMWVSFLHLPHSLALYYTCVSFHALKTQTSHWLYGFLFRGIRGSRFSSFIGSTCESFRLLIAGQNRAFFALLVPSSVPLCGVIVSFIGSMFVLCIWFFRARQWHSFLR